MASLGSKRSHRNETVNLWHSVEKEKKIKGAFISIQDRLKIQYINKYTRNLPSSEDYCAAEDKSLSEKC